MIFQKTPQKLDLEESIVDTPKNVDQSEKIETIVGPSVQVEGDFASEGDIIIRGVVTGSVHTSKQVIVDMGGRVLAEMHVGSAKISGKVKGNIKANELVELTSSAEVEGNIETQVLVVNQGAKWCGQINMLGAVNEQNKKNK